MQRLLYLFSLLGEHIDLEISLNYLNPVYQLRHCASRHICSPVYQPTDLFLIISQLSGLDVRFEQSQILYLLKMAIHLIDISLIHIDAVLFPRTARVVSRYHVIA